MSKYLINVGSSIVAALDGVSSAQPAMVAGYWANIDFWLEEFRHFVRITDGYKQRSENMKVSHDRYCQKHGGPHNRNEFGQPHQSAMATTSDPERKRIVGAVRSSLMHVADRALNLRIITNSQYDEFIEQLKAV